MPIRINLLAEQQAAEEARRRDPVKRALFGGSALVVFMLLWTGLLQLQVNGARKSLSRLEEDLKKAEENAIPGRTTQAMTGDIENRIKSLEKYSTNRVLWASTLNALQAASMDSIRLMDVNISQKYTFRPKTNLFMTNIIADLPKPPAKWKFWATASTGPAPTTLAEKQLAGVTNGPPFTTNSLPYTTKMTLGRTNEVKMTVSVDTEFVLPAIAIEEISMTLTARDYGPPAGSVIPRFAKQLAAVPYFKAHLPANVDPVRISRGANADVDQTDFLVPAGLFVPFTARMNFEERVLTNE